MSMERRGLSNSIGAVLLVVGILIGAGGYYLATTEFISTSTSASHSTTSAFSQSSKATTPVSSCSASTPLALKSVVWGTTAESPSVYLATVWSNCASQPISFTVGLKNLNVTISTYGKTSYVTGRFLGCNGELTCFVSASAYGTTTVSLEIYFDTAVSPNAIILSSTGNLTAFDPRTGQIISSSVSFTT